MLFFYVKRIKGRGGGVGVGVGGFRESQSEGDWKTGNEIDTEIHHTLSKMSRIG